MKDTKVIVFDLYNTLIEIQQSGHFFLEVFKASQNGFGMQTFEYIQLVMKNNIENLKSILPSEFSTLYHEKQKCLALELNSIIVYDEVVKTLEALKKEYKLFLISNLASPYKEPIFSNGLDQYFEEMIFSCDCGFLKPEIDIFKKVENITQCKANEILMVGDSFKSDVMGAKSVGWNYLKINRHISISEKYEIKSLEEIKDKISE